MKGMKMMRGRDAKRILVAGLSALAIASGAAAAATGATRAGAGRADVTPPKRSLGTGDSIRDKVYARAIYVETGQDCALLVGLDQGILSNEAYKGAVDRLNDLGCPAENIIISATHTHSGSNGGGAVGAEPTVKAVEDAIVAAVREAKAKARPARAVWSTTNVDLNTNRDLFVDGQWLQGPNSAGSSDKTLALLSFIGADDKPIAVYMNYAMHPINYYLSGVVSGDYAGAASRYVEDHFGGDMVAVFALGAAGDQNPKFVGPLYELMGHRAGVPELTDHRVTATPAWFTMARNLPARAKVTANEKPPVLAERMAAYRKAVEDVGKLVDAEGAMLGEAVNDMLRYRIGRLDGNLVIRGASQNLQCPGRTRADADNPVRQGKLPPYTDGPEVDLKVGMLRLGDAYISSVNGEVYSDIAIRLKREAPAAKLMMATVANGLANSGYIYSNDADHRLTFQVIGSRLKPGCAEDAIVETSLDMIGNLSK